MGQRMGWQKVLALSGVWSGNNDWTSTAEGRLGRQRRVKGYTRSRKAAGARNDRGMS